MRKPMHAWPNRRMIAHCALCRRRLAGARPLGDVAGACAGRTERDGDGWRRARGVRRCWRQARRRHSADRAPTAGSRRRADRAGCSGSVGFPTAGSISARLAGRRRAPIWTPLVADASTGGVGDVRFHAASVRRAVLQGCEVRRRRRRGFARRRGAALVPRRDRERSDGSRRWRSRSTGAARRSTRCPR